MVCGFFYLLTKSCSPIKDDRIISGVHCRTVKGNFVQIEDGPAAVTGDESGITSLSYSVNNRNMPGRRMKRMIRKSEDLPEKSVCLSAVTNQPIFCGHFITVFYAVLACINDKVMFERRLIFNHAESLPSWIIGNEYVILWIQRDIPGSITLMASSRSVRGHQLFGLGSFFP